MKQCQICREEFDFEGKIPRLMGNCGHTMCEECLDNYLVVLREKFETFKRFILKCPFDQIDHFVKVETRGKDFPKNFTMIE